MSLRDVNVWRVDDHFPGVAIDDIPFLSDKLNSLYARAIHREHLKSSFTELEGIIFMAKELEYHFDNFQRLIAAAGLPTTVGQMINSGRHQTIDKAKFEAIAYINTVGRINTWISHNKYAAAPKIAEISIFRNKHTAHRSIDAPRGESEDLQDLHAFIFTHNLWSPQGELLLQIQEKLGQMVELNIIQDHKTVSDEILEAFSKVLEP